ncbi:MAG: DUF4105 domain-containing protein [Tannerellaceae bacterium]
MKKSVFISLLLCMLISFSAHAALSDKAQISLLTSSASDEAVFTLYGHAAIRVCDSSQNLDMVFNYGIFDFSKPNFIFRFAKGETDYMLGVTEYLNYVIEYQMRGSEVTEQRLNLAQEEKERIWQALFLNYEPQNRVYRYNFFFDNCATRPVVLVEKGVSGKLTYHHKPQPQTFRDLINHATRNHPWLTFGCDLALGSPTDREATQHEELFLPQYLRQAFAKATITTPDGTSRPLVAETTIISEADPEKAEYDAGIFTPLLCSTLFCLLIAAITLWEWRHRSYYRLVDCVLFFIAGLAGVVLFFLSFVSVHPCTFPNWSLVWLQPLDLVAVILFSVKKLKKAAYYYHFINFAALTLMLVGWHFIPQHLNTAFIPLVATLWMRSGYSVYRNKLTNG